MRTLIVLAIIAGVAFIFAAPANSFNVPFINNMPKTLLDKANEIGNLIKINPASTGDTVAGVKNLISKTVDRISETIKAPIEDKIKDIICPKE